MNFGLWFETNKRNIYRIDEPLLERFLSLYKDTCITPINNNK